MSLPGLAPDGRLVPRDWLSGPATRALVAALTAQGAAVRFVGGSVRDALIDRPVKDVDLATPDPPEAVMTLLKAARIRVVPTGLAHGTVTAVVEHRPYEITTLRRDVSTDGRRATVAFTDDWTEDAARRDFTINALSADPDGTLHDPFGGVADLVAGRVRFVGDPATRLAEDVLRLLRFFRFHAWYGRGAPDPAGLAACVAAAPKLPILSGERVQGELKRLLEAPDPAPVMRLILDRAILAPILPQLGRPERLAALVAIEPAPDAIRRLAALVMRDGATVAERLRLSNAEAARLALLSQPPIDVAALAGAGEPAWRRALQAHGGDKIRDLTLLAEASGVDADFAGLRALAARWVAIAFPLEGRDVVALGVAPGPRVGELLAAVRTWWEAGDYRATRAACRARLKELITVGG